MFKILFRLLLSFPSTLFLFQVLKVFIFPFSIMFVIFAVFGFVFFFLLKSSPFHNLIFPLGSVSLVPYSHCNIPPLQNVRMHKLWHSLCLSLCFFHACMSNLFVPLPSGLLHSPLPAQQHLSSLLQSPSPSLLMLTYLWEGGSWEEEVEKKRQMCLQALLYCLTQTDFSCIPPEL